MDALILAAGLGSRLEPITNNHPKAMVNYNGKEIIYHQLTRLLEQNINKIIIVSGYKAEVLGGFLKKEFPAENLKIIENKKFASTNSAYSFYNAYKSITSESYIHLNCDILFSNHLLKQVIDNPNENVIACRKDIQFTDAMENVISKNNRIVNMSLRHTPEVSRKGFGLAKISMSAVHENIKQYEKLVPKIQNIENYYGLIRMTLGIVNYFTEDSNKYELAEINTHDDLKTCSFRL